MAVGAVAVEAVAVEAAVEPIAVEAEHEFQAEEEGLEVVQIEAEAE